MAERARELSNNVSNVEFRKRKLEGNTNKSKVIVFERGGPGCGI